MVPVCITIAVLLRMRETGSCVKPCSTPALMETMPLIPFLLNQSLAHDSSSLVLVICSAGGSSGSTHMYWFGLPATADPSPDCTTYAFPVEERGEPVQSSRLEPAENLFSPKRSYPWRVNFEASVVGVV